MVQQSFKVTRFDRQKVPDRVRKEHAELAGRLTPAQQSELADQVRLGRQRFDAFCARYGLEARPDTFEVFLESRVRAKGGWGAVRREPEGAVWVALNEDAARPKAAAKDQASRATLHELIHARLGRSEDQSSGVRDLSRFGVELRQQVTWESLTPAAILAIARRASRADETLLGEDRRLRACANAFGREAVFASLAKGLPPTAARIQSRGESAKGVRWSIARGGRINEAMVEFLTLVAFDVDRLKENLPSAGYWDDTRQLVQLYLTLPEPTRDGMVKAIAATQQVGTLKPMVHFFRDEVGAEVRPAQIQELDFDAVYAQLRVAPASLSKLKGLLERLRRR